MKPLATTALEQELLTRFSLVAGVDEVGRGALAGPVSVGVVVVGPDTEQASPPGLTDSKLLSSKQRQELVEPIRRWCQDSEVAHASPQEIDQLGIIGGLHLAAQRALAKLAQRQCLPEVVILDGNHDWLTPRTPDLMTELFQGEIDSDTQREHTPAVYLQKKADQRHSVVAAASILAKQCRDALMEELPDPGYGWATNRGYASPAHLRALRKRGLSPHHRHSWKIPGKNSN